MERTARSIKNLSIALIGQAFGLVISFISRIIFIRILGSEYLGLNGLFTNILTMLSLAELGVGEAITYSLYKPLARNDQSKCKMLMQLYKKVYIVIGIIIFIIGIAITPILHFFIKKMPDISNINLIYILFVCNTAISYFFSYKRNLIIADQKRYIATIFRYIFYFLLNLIQIIYIIFEKNYIGFLIIQNIFTLLENISISIKANKMYPYLKEKDKIMLDDNSKRNIIKNTKAMMMHKIGGIVVSSTDNILISSYIGLVDVGIYSNYYMIFNALNIIFSQLFSSIMASVGNLCVVNTKDEQYVVFEKVNFLNFWIYSISSICLMILINQFIEIWIGSNYLFNMQIVLILVLNFYIGGMRKSVLTFREANGLFYKDRWKAIFEAIVNLVISILLIKYFGTLGIFLGTFISTVSICAWVEPYILFKYGFNKKVNNYFKKYIKYLIVTMFLGLITYYICSFIKGNIYISLILKLIISLLLPNLILVIFYRKNEYFKYYIGLLQNLMKKIIKKAKKKNLFSRN